MAQASGRSVWPMSPGIVAESDLQGNLQSEYVFFNGKRVARKDFPSNAVSYYYSDELKTADVITDSAGNIKYDADHYPWGGELPFINNDSNHYKYGGHERDAETGCDYLDAREYCNSFSRFLTPDWAGKPTTVPYADFGNPQSLNLYSYTKNNPTTFGDPDGHCCLDAVVDFTMGALNAWGSDNLAGAGRMEQTTLPGKFGQAIGDLGATVQGAVETLAGGAGEVGGTVLDSTGVGAIVGLPLNVASAGAIVHGSVTTATAGKNLMKDVTGGNSGSSSSGQSGQGTQTNTGSKPTSLPVEGEPGTTTTKLHPDGSPKQVREYGPDGKAKTDVDFHRSPAGNPHAHDWDHSGEQPQRGGPRPIKPTDKTQ